MPRIMRRLRQTRRQWHVLITAIFCIAALVVAPSAVIRAANSAVTVNDTLDEIHNPGCATTGRGTCSLRDAVLYANANVTRLGRPRGR
jgi:hypothetical protein